MSHLDRLVADARREMEQRRAGLDDATIERAAEIRARRGDRRDFLAALQAPGISLIAEHKRRSPSAGAIREDLSLDEVVQAYERGGASAISVLTDSPSFGGSLEDLAQAREVTKLPILRKDFIVDRYQLLEAVVAGADAVLLIVGALSAERLARLAGDAGELGLTALIEVHDAHELEVAMDVGASLVGINNRDLTTLEVDVRTTFDLVGRINGEATVVAESGLRARVQLEELGEAGVDAVLIGEALMRAEDVAGAVRELVGPTIGS